MVLDVRLPASDIVARIREMDVLYHVIMMAKVTISPKKQIIIVHAGYHRCSMPVHAEDAARTEILKQVVSARPTTRLPHVVFDESMSTQSNRRRASGLGDLLDPICTAIEFYVMESRPVLPEEVDAILTNRPFAENNLKGNGQSAGTE